MLDQHPGRQKVLAGLENLPFEEGAFGAATAVTTVHHWPDPHRGLDELRRVSHRQVVFTRDPHHLPEPWLIEEYLPEIRELEHARFTPLPTVVEAPGRAHRAALPRPVRLHRRLPDRVPAASGVLCLRR
ncbi:methyltransferase domain-containing protein [Streptomyces pratens]|uniref:Methyltransferase domain-containing protein n=1 Tax=Streptomyces pratens TaxID=887456 RepID=A0ABW1M4K8_9ACTN